MTATVIKTYRAFHHIFYPYDVGCSDLRFRAVGNSGAYGEIVIALDCFHGRVIMPTFRNSISSAISRNTKSVAVGAVVCAFFVPTVSALTITNVGSPGAAGITKPAPSRGGSGGNAKAEAASSDFVNTFQATAGKGGTGGSSTMLAPGAAGGHGGGATAKLTSQGQILPDNVSDVSLTNSVVATGAAGGDGGAGLIAGNGGAGGRGTAVGIQKGASQIPENGPVVSDTLTVNANGGAGGKGFNGGAGGAADASARHTPDHSVGGAFGSATAQGGAGGDGYLLGGRGGNAHAVVKGQLSGYPSYNAEDAVAIGGRGGNSVTGQYGDGGDARASASGSFAARDLGLDITARAIGGGSGNGAANALSGKGGNAFATASGSSSNAAYAYPQAIAQGGAGAARGGDAVAYAKGVGVMSAGASATATGGAGPTAGVASATAVGVNSWLGTGASATANYSGSLGRSVTASASTLALENGPAESRIFAQATAGDTAQYDAARPANATVVRGSIAPSTAAVNAALAGNTNIANTLQGGAVWGLGEYGTSGGEFDSIEGSISYIFDTADATANHLWLGLLDTDLPANTPATFHFAVAGEGQTLFEHDFSGTEFFDFFNDRAFDLGDWSALVSSDGLFDLNVSFSGYAPHLDFLLGAADLSSVAEFSNVPEPSSAWLLIGGLAGLLVSRNLVRRENRTGNREVHKYAV